MTLATREEIEEFFRDTENYVPEDIPPWQSVLQCKISVVERVKLENCLKACWERILELETDLSNKSKIISDLTSENELLENLLLYFGKKKAIQALTENYKKEKNEDSIRFR